MATYFNEYNFEEQYWNNKVLSLFIDYAIEDSPETGFPGYLFTSNTTKSFRTYVNNFYEKFENEHRVDDTETPSNKQKFRTIKAQFTKLYSKLNVDEIVKSQMYQKKCVALSKKNKSVKEQNDELHQKLVASQEENAKLYNGFEILRNQLKNEKKEKEELENEKNDLEKEFLKKSIAEKEKLIEIHQKDKERLKGIYCKKLKLRGSEIEEKKEREIQDLKHKIENLELQNQLLELKLTKK